jgi:heme-degrading monooxygenase HmoA
MNEQQPQPPYFAVIFTSVRTAADDAGYERTAERMVELARQQPGFLGIESVRGADGLGITVSYWSSEAAIRQWRDEAEHQLAQEQGREKWYSRFALRICRVERAWEFEAG